MTFDPNKSGEFPPATGRELPSREEHDALIRRIWKWCIIGAVSVFAITGGITGGLYLAGHDGDKILRVSTTIFQILVLSYGMGFFVPAFCTSLLKMSLGVEMSREGLEVGKKTASHIDRLQKELETILKDAREIVGPIRELVEDLKRAKTGKVVEFMEELSKSGSVERIAKSVEEIAKKAHDVLEKVKKDAASDMIDKI